MSSDKSCFQVLPSRSKAGLVNWTPEAGLQGGKGDAERERAETLEMARAFLGDGTDPKDPLASPIFAPADALRALPPVYVAVGDADVSLDDALTFCRNARRALCIQNNMHMLAP